ncbi:hypothetical protein DID88_000830 [Monilinia fructigena]|uniref:Uncharacterized protein n=1 Tax=Monilinia fructigena TaxID=38457 RepID=A0A395IIY8_9HELO|nr:hypothetical protein DID88_000830 [Monilinia fructigena]
MRTGFPCYPLFPGYLREIEKLWLLSEFIGSRPSRVLEIAFLSSSKLRASHRKQLLSLSLSSISLSKTQT